MIPCAPSLHVHTSTHTHLWVCAGCSHVHLNCCPCSIILIRQLNYKTACRACLKPNKNSTTSFFLWMSFSSKEFKKEELPLTRKFDPNSLHSCLRHGTSLTNKHYHSRKLSRIILENRLCIKHILEFDIIYSPVFFFI